MTRARVAWVVVGAVAVVAVGMLATVGGGAATQNRSAGTDVRSELSPADRAAIQRVVSRFAIAISNHVKDQPMDGPARAESGLVTPAFGRELRAQTQVVTAAESATTQRLDVESVAVRPGPPPTALVLGTLVVSASDHPPIRAPVTWVLNVIDTTGGWRVAAATS